MHVGADVANPVLLQNDIFVGQGTVTDQMGALQVANFTGDPKLVDQAHFDDHLTAGSPCIDQGRLPGAGDGFPLAPDHDYVHPAGMGPRLLVNAIDVGAYEFGSAPDAGAAATDGAMGSMDAAAVVDAAILVDGAAPADAATHAPAPDAAIAGSSNGGCSCGIAGGRGVGGSPLMAVIVLLGIAAALRRRHPR